MKIIGIFLPENIQFLVVKFSIYLNRRVFVMANDAIFIHSDNDDSDPTARMRKMI